MQRNLDQPSKPQHQQKRLDTQRRPGPFFADRGVRLQVVSYLSRIERCSFLTLSQEQIPLSGEIDEETIEIG